MRRFTKLGLVGLGLIALLTVGASPAAAKKGKTRTVTRTAAFNQCVSTAIPVPDAPPTTATGDLQPRPSTSFAVPVTVPNIRGKSQDGVVTAFTSAGVRISHTFNGDLSLFLVSPGGKVSTLAFKRDGNPSGDGYGNGAASCAGGLVTFGDLFPTPIATPTNTTPTGAPITGSYKPESPLGVFAGGPARGFWTLLVHDDANVDVGAIHALSLNFTYTYRASVKVKNKKKK